MSGSIGPMLAQAGQGDTADESPRCSIRRGSEPLGSATADAFPMRSLAGNAAGAPAPAADARTQPRCETEPLEETRFLFIDSFQLKRIERGEKPAERAVFRKRHGVAKGLMTVAAGCPAALRVGLWSGGPYDAWMRWSSDAPPDTPDLMDNTLGFAIKLFGVAGRTLAADDPLGRTADLVLQNSDVFFVDDAREMCAISRDGPAFEATHLRSKEILDEMAKREASLLAATYHSGHPYAIGDFIVKFRLVPQAPDPGAPGTSANYLAEDLRSRLLSHNRAFLLQAQAFIDQSVTPVDRASVRWEERHAPFASHGSVRQRDRRRRCRPGEAPLDCAFRARRFHRVGAVPSAQWRRSHHGAVRPRRLRQPRVGRLAVDVDGRWRRRRGVRCVDRARRSKVY